ncbi:thiamine phosphate synthase [Acuticoccus sp. I52.16.1]|uniref:thiamine phosphate synthase n=1 Tax=Acuticoccus sp. I52.16.1 TaxID=2928472 RepID=UPI001FD51E2E|nr:thiamine phosphate synthase [Acuticoccus sp. I52.16.1]UOM34640.1 thiamine phosphate synthase [Acuticoccus sp. I52.16.1]
MTPPSIAQSVAAAPDTAPAVRPVTAPAFPVADVAATLGRLAMARPRVHALVAPVAQPLVANVAAAAGVDISMTVDAEEVRPMAAKSGAICVNLGMLDSARRAGILSAVRTGTPFMLDPVKVDRVPARLAFARELLAYEPKVVKGNAAEMLALGPVPDGTVAVTSGAVDRISVRTAAGDRTLYLANGTSKLARVTGTGCAAGMLIASMLAIESDPLLAAIAGLSLMNVSGEMVAPSNPGPGSFATALLDAIGTADAQDIAARIRVVAPPLDPRLYLLLGPGEPDPLRTVRAATAGGVTLVQWRDKTGSTAEQVAAVRALVAASPVPVLVNDRADVARAAGAAGVHVGHGDLTAAQAREIAGPTAIIGLTIHTLEEAVAADDQPIDYASVGGVFETTSKVNPNPPIGIDGFRRIAERLRRRRPDLPVIAIAGIDEARAEALAGAGADGIAVISAITKAASPRAAAEALRRAFAGARSDEATS